MPFREESQGWETLDGGVREVEGGREEGRVSGGALGGGGMVDETGSLQRTSREI